jgi:hypothetical protein
MEIELFMALLRAFGYEIWLLFVCSLLLLSTYLFSLCVLSFSELFAAVIQWTVKPKHFRRMLPRS